MHSGEKHTYHTENTMHSGEKHTTAQHTIQRATKRRAAIAQWRKVHHTIHSEDKHTIQRGAKRRAATAQWRKAHHMIHSGEKHTIQYTVEKSTCTTQRTGYTVEESAIQRGAKRRAAIAHCTVEKSTPQHNIQRSDEESSY